MLRTVLLGLSLYWRLLVVSLVLATVIVFFLLRVAPSDDVTFIKLKPTFLYALSGVIWLASLLAQPNGIVYLVWGKRLNLPTHQWRWFTVALALVFFALALANALAAFLLSVEGWLQFKLYVPLATVFLATFAAAGYMSQLPSSAIGTHVRSGEA